VLQTWGSRSYVSARTYPPAPEEEENGLQSGKK